MIGGVVCAKKPRAPVAPGVPSAGQAAVRVSSGKPGRRFPRHQGLARRAGARVGHSGGAYKPKEGVHRKDWLPGRASSRTRRTPPGVMSGHCTNKLWYIERAGRMMGGYRLTAVGAPCRGGRGAQRSHILPWALGWSPRRPRAVGLAAWWAPRRALRQPGAVALRPRRARSSTAVGPKMDCSACTFKAPRGARPHQ